MKEKDLLKALGFLPKENTSDIFYKKYQGYSIDVDFKKQKFDYGNEIKFGSSTTLNFSQPENWVIIECVNRLLEKGYSPYNIILEKTWKTGHGTSGRLDILVTRDNGSAYLMIECKTWGAEFDKEFKKMEKDGGQLFTYFQQDKHADILMLYSSKFQGNSIEFKNNIVKVEDDYRQAGNVKGLFEQWNKKTYNKGVWNSPLYDFQIKKITVNDLDDLNEEAGKKLFHGFAHILRKHSVSDKPNAFNVIFNLFLAKLYDEQKRDTDELEFRWRENDDPVDFQVRLYNLHKSGLYDFLKKEIEGIQDSDFKTTTVDDLKKAKKKFLKFNKLFDIKSVLDDDDFDQNHRVLQEVVELLQDYKIRYPQKQRYLSDFFELLLTTGLKQEVGQYFTPPPITKFIVKSLPIQEMLETHINQPTPQLPAVIDYAVGSGHFITEIMEEYQDIINTKINDKDFYPKAKKEINAWKVDPYSWAAKYVYGIEKDYRLVKVAKVGCYFYGDGLAQIVHGDGLDSFAKSKSYVGLLKENTNLEDSSKAKFSIVISNPPYSVSGCKDDLEYINAQDDFSLYSNLTEKSSEIECLFVERTKQLLKDGGVAGVILPSSILNNSGIYSNTREILLKYFEIIAIAELGSNTFMATGTNTVTLFLRRRNNAVACIIEEAIKKIFINLHDVTINGIENPITTYINYVWESITFDDYITLIQGNPNEKVLQHEIYQEYKKNIKAKTANQLSNKINAIEQEKLLYFILTYSQKLVLVKTGQKKEEKRFLGYKFSNRRGSEGIHPIQRSKSIDECTQLYDAKNYDNPDKASTYIYKAFNNEFDLAIPEKLKKNISYQNLVDMLTFDRSDFEKSISLSIKKKVKFESKWEQVSLREFDNIEFINGYAFKSSDLMSYKIDDNHIKVLKIGNISSNDNETNFLNCEYHTLLKYSEKIVNIGEIAIALTGATVGKAGWVTERSLLNQRVLAIRGLQSNLIYISTYLFSDKFYNYSQEMSYGNAQGNLSPDQVKDFKIPLPPIDIQEKIVAEIEELASKENMAVEEIEDSKNRIFQSLSVNRNLKETKLVDIAILLKRGKSAKYGISKTQIIKSGQARGYKKFDFSEKHFVDDNFVLDERKLQQGDILINSSGVGTAGRVTMFNLDGVFVVDSHITILRVDNFKALSEYVLYALAKLGFKTIESMATGQSGQIELSLGIIKNIKIPLPTISEQEKIVAEIKILEAEIAKLEELIANIPAQKEAILKKYL